MTSKKYSLGIDYGTQSGRALLVEVATAVILYADGVIDEVLPGTNIKLAEECSGGLDCLDSGLGNFPLRFSSLHEYKIHNRRVTKKTLLGGDEHIIYKVFHCDRRRAL